jgi:SAM-dependent methyltransferase
VTPPRFDWLAPHYAWVERTTHGGLLQWTRTALVGELTDARRVLILGEGDGRFLAAFRAANPAADVDVVAASPAMVALARRQIAGLPGGGRVRWHVADARRAELPRGPHDLVVTNFVLDCFGPADLAPLVARLAAALAPGGRWLVGDYALPAGGAARSLARLTLAGMYAAFALTTRIPARALTDPAPLLRANGLTPEREARCLGGFLAATLWRKGG